MRWLVILILLLAPSYQISKLEQRSELIIWNVGQGQWVTWILPGPENECRHFDIGGDLDQSSKVAKRCRGLKNRFFLSHWDWDHIGLLPKYLPQISDACLQKGPVGEANERKTKLLARLPQCEAVRSPWWLELFRAPLEEPQFRNLSRKTNNHLSHVFWLKTKKILIPGDSTTIEEKIWSKVTPRSTKGLILGHHGSRTSTSDLLLAQLPELKWAVSSARFSRYGHPHQDIVQRLKKNKVPLLKTEDWGTLHFLE